MSPKLSLPRMSSGRLMPKRVIEFRRAPADFRMVLLQANLLNESVDLDSARRERQASRIAGVSRLSANGSGGHLAAAFPRTPRGLRGQASVPKTVDTRSTALAAPCRYPLSMVRVNAALPRRISSGDFPASRAPSLRASSSTCVSGHDPADQSELHRFLGREDTPGEQQVERTVAADDARQMGVVDGRQQSDLHFRIAEVGGFGGDEHVARDGHRHAAAAHRAGDGGNRRLGQAGLQLVQLPVQLVDQRMHLRRRASPELRQVQPAAETSGDGAAEDDRPDLRIASQRLERRHHFIEQGGDEAVDRRIVHQDGGDTVLDVDLQQLRHDCLRLDRRRERASARGIGISRG